MAEADSQSAMASSESPLTRMAAAKFPNLTRAELALLEFADIDNPNRGEWAAAGPSQKPLDPTNDPKDAATWTRDRDIRVALIEWMAVDHAALERIHAGGVRILGARILGSLNLSNLRVPFGITMVRCSIPEQMRFEATEIPRLDLAGSHTGEIFAGDIQVNGGLYIGYDGHEYGDFAASGEVYVGGGRVDGDLVFNGGHFQSSRVSMEEWKTPQNVALDASDIKVEHLVALVGVESKGAVLLTGARIGGDLACAGGHFFNSNKVALDLTSARIDGNVYLALGMEPYKAFESDGAVNFIGTRIDGLFIVNNAKFHGKAGERHGMFAPGLVSGPFNWLHVDLENGATLDLSAAAVHGLDDDVGSWPQPGHLLIDGFTYTGFGHVKSAAERLRWLGLESEFYPQPYRQLAKVLRASGDDEGAVRVLIAEQDARFRNSYLIRRIWAGFLKTTVGYGHEPLLTIIWATIVVLLGWLMVAIGKRAGVMRLTWPETTPPPPGNPVAGLNPLLYSLDVFLPFVNLHQEHYWWPDENAVGNFKVVGRAFSVRGSALRAYLWMQIIAGWLLSAIFIAGVTGLIRTFED